MKNHENLLSILNQIVTDLFVKSKSKALAVKILKIAQQFTNADRGSIFLVNQENTKHLHSVVATGLDGQEIEIDITKGVAGKVYRTGEACIINDLSTSSEFDSSVDAETGYQTQNIISVPLTVPNGQVIGAIELLNKKSGKFDSEDLQLLKVLGLFAGIALDHNSTVGQLEDTKNKLSTVNKNWLRQSMDLLHESENSQLGSIYENLRHYAISESAILVEGESGTGKEGLTQLIHLRSHRSEQPFVAVNCAAIPESLFEAELFGVAKGAATGTQPRKGKFELAHGGTLFLDEIGELPLAEQAKLLRVLQEQTVSRVGSDKAPVFVDFRLICATNRNLEELVRQGEFREDLYYRINVIHLKVPSLAERREDLPQLAEKVMKNLATKSPLFRNKKLDPQCLVKFMDYDWPGNIRELHNKIETAALKSRDRPIIRPEDFDIESTVQVSIEPQESNNNVIGLREAKERAEKQAIQKALAQSGGNKSEAARLLGISREGLRKALKKSA